MLKQFKDDFAPHCTFYKAIHPQTGKVSNVMKNKHLLFGRFSSKHNQKHTEHEASFPSPLH
jgi:hypothetical protein